MAKDGVTVTVTAADLPVVRANVRALDIVIGLIGSDYPKNIMSRFINECVDLKQDGLLDANMMYGVQFIGSTVGTETYQKLVEYLAERIRKDDELARAEEEIRATGDGTWNGGNSKCYVETADKLPEEAGADADDRTGAKKAPARKQAGVKTAARVAAAGKKTVTQTRKKATGAADGK